MAVGRSLFAYFDAAQARIVDFEIKKDNLFLPKIYRSDIVRENDNLVCAMIFFSYEDACTFFDISRGYLYKIMTKENPFNKKAPRKGEYLGIKLYEPAVSAEIYDKMMLHNSFYKDSAWIFVYDLWKREKELGERPNDMMKLSKLQKGQLKSLYEDRIFKKLEIKSLFDS